MTASVIQIRKPALDRCPTCKRRMTRTHVANARYWLLLHKLSDQLRPDGVTYSAETWHRYCASRFLGNDEFVLPNKKLMLIPKSTSALDVEQFGDYMDAVEAFANERNVWLDD